MRGFYSLAPVVLAASTALAADSFYSASTAGFGGVDISSTTSSLSNSGIDRLLEVNASEDSLFRAQPMDSADAVEVTTPSAEVVTPFAETESTSPSPLLMLGGVAAAFAMGLGLCFAGLMSGRKRTISTFAAGFVRLK